MSTLQDQQSVGSLSWKRWASEISAGETEDGKLKRPVVKLAPMFYESVFREKNRAGNVGASHQQAKKVDLEHAG